MRIPKLLRRVTFSVRYTNIIERTNIFQSYLKRANWSPLAAKQTGLFVEFDPARAGSIHGTCLGRLVNKNFT